MDQENLTQFLTELTALSRKHGLVIGGCGCCGSPFIYPVDERHADPGIVYCAGVNDRGEVNDLELVDPEKHRGYCIYTPVSGRAV